MAFRRRVTPMRTGAETLRWGSVRGSGRAPNSFHPCGAASARPHRDRGQSKLVLGDVGVVLNEVSAEHDVQQGYALAELRDSAKTRIGEWQSRRPGARRPKFVSLSNNERRVASLGRTCAVLS